MESRQAENEERGRDSGEGGQEEEKGGESRGGEKKRRMWVMERETRDMVWRERNTGNKEWGGKRVRLKGAG